MWPPPRSYHTATLVEFSETVWKVYVIGGKGKIDLENDVYELEITIAGENNVVDPDADESISRALMARGACFARETFGCLKSSEILAVATPQPPPARSNARRVVAAFPSREWAGRRQGVATREKACESDHTKGRVARGQGRHAIEERSWR